MVSIYIIRKLTINWITFYKLVCPKNFWLGIHCQLSPGLDVRILMLGLSATALTFLKNWEETWNFNTKLYSGKQYLFSSSYFCFMWFMSLFSACIRTKLCPRKLLYILWFHAWIKKVHEIENWFFHSFERYFEHTSTHIQKHGKHMRSGVLLKYLTVYPCLLITWILNTPVIYTSWTHL